MLRKSITVIPHPTEANTLIVPLTRGYEALIDAADLEIGASRLWYASVMKHGVYAHHKDSAGVVSLHSLILQPPPGMFTDHISGNTLDNRRRNLRAVDKRKNAWNARLAGHNTTGFRGVHYRGDRGTWSARIKRHGRYETLGSFDSAEEAAIAYDEALRCIAGSDGRYNFPRSGEEGIRRDGAA